MHHPNPFREEAAMASTPLILLPIDGSESSLRAAVYCANLAKAFGATVLVLNVQPEVEDWQTHGLGRDAAIGHLNDRARAAIAAAQKVLAPTGVPHETLVEFGDAPDTIARIAESRGCSQVVMGTRGQSELKSRLMGAVGMKVIHQVKVPVTFVH